MGGLASAVVITAALVAGCSSSSSDGAYSAPTFTQEPLGTVSLPTATVHPKPRPTTRRQVPTDGKSTKGPVGGSSCSFRAAFWTLEGHDVEVMVTLPPVTYVSISVLSKSGNPAGNGAGSILAGRIGADINVTVRGSTKGIGVSLAASGAVSGLCAVPKLG